MSGFVAMLRTDGAPVDAELIRELTASQAVRGPDAQHTWCRGSVALGHTLLRASRESDHERQPLTLDGCVHIVADGRVDARDELIRALAVDETESVLRRAPDAELIMRAYLRWGDDCVEHLVGDFAFAIWDGRTRRLFCARDHMGVKPFYYACVGRSIVVASTVEAIRRHPNVSDRLNELAIADFLLFGYNQDVATTSFHDIHRLPAAHTLASDGSGAVIRRYWMLPIDEPLYLARDRDYVEGYRDIVGQAVSDRLGTDRVSIFMSGGLDSSGLAASAAALLANRTTQPVKAFTFVYDRLIPDSERAYAGIVARHLQIPISFYALDDETWQSGTDANTPEPTATLTDQGIRRRAYTDMAGHSRVALYGEGPDNALSYEWQGHLGYLLRNRRYLRFAADIIKHLIAHKRAPLISTIPRMISERRGSASSDPSLPPWLPAELLDRLHLQERWHAFTTADASPHPVRPRAYQSLLGAQWQNLFETLEPSYTKVPLEIRHPYMDVRVLRYFLRVPTMPWCRIKRIQREALRGVVPEIVRRRPKTPLMEDPNHARCRRLGFPQPHRDGIPAAYGGAATLSRWPDLGGGDADLRFVALSHWLATGGSTTSRQEKDESHGKAFADITPPQETLQPAGAPGVR